MITMNTRGYYLFEEEFRTKSLTKRNMADLLNDLLRFWLGWSFCKGGCAAPKRQHGPKG